MRSGARGNPLGDNLAELYRRQGRYADAVPLYQRSLAIWEKALGRDHPDAATSLNNLASLYASQGRYAYAEPLYQRSLALLEKALRRPEVDLIGVDRASLSRAIDNGAVVVLRRHRLNRLGNFIGVRPFIPCARADDLAQLMIK
jgi:tetratricopeptide (TPR) repeat protein